MPYFLIFLLFVQGFTHCVCVCVCVCVIERERERERERKKERKKEKKKERKTHTHTHSEREREREREREESLICCLTMNKNPTITFKINAFVNFFKYRNLSLCMLYFLQLNLNLIMQ